MVRCDMWAGGGGAVSSSANGHCRTFCMQRLYVHLLYVHVHVGQWTDSWDNNSHNTGVMRSVCALGRLPYASFNGWFVA